MNRRRFLELLGTGMAATGVVYSFPSIIVPRNIETGLTMLSYASADPSFPIAVGPNNPSLLPSVWIDFYSQQLTEARNWFRLNDPWLNLPTESPNYP